LNATPVAGGLLAVATGAFLAAVYLVAEARRRGALGDGSGHRRRPSS
jgi:hypothetical protein